ncbi:Ribosomal protein S18 acetylase RimI [Lutibacter agarilyticus]|uniref:Ribosomal protein S18 acetylase RimI n=1 Tax=Lutibacter agarilyticus TaxID=1109740 RepID=A0A238VY23_9FLAO|nr:GNAT family N-acetyltransferase [Lutibacter agarilyticus]SNR39034.1 Ribosomal protein S18 acetylase RimI [Lutibacter agarilyticus]
MNLIRLRNISDTYFQEAWQLYEEAFPFEERRILDDQISVLKNSKYHFEVVINENQFIGFILWWDFETLKYIDHFATSAEQRNKGYGKLILNEFINDNSKPILLEVELPTSSTNQRRIKFYERIGFKLNQHPYEVPNAKINEPPLPLLLMSYPNQITSKEVDLFIRKCHPIIFKF